MTKINRFLDSPARPYTHDSLSLQTSLFLRFHLPPGQPCENLMVLCIYGVYYEIIPSSVRTYHGAASGPSKLTKPMPLAIYCWADRTESLRRICYTNSIRTLCICCCRRFGCCCCCRPCKSFKSSRANVDDDGGHAAATANVKLKGTADRRTSKWCGDKKTS